jgi:hypothetical protein
MRKVTLVFMSLALTAVIVNAQDLTNKKGFTILPESGDYALGFDAVPFFDFMLNVSNIMNNTGQTSQHPGYVSGFSNVIVGKYFMEDDMAIRVKVGINMGSSTSVLYFDDPADIFANPTDPDSWGEISDVTKSGGSLIVLGGGVEYRRGHNRLQGFYGGEALIGVQTSKTTNEYGVEITADAITNGYTNGDGSPLSPRILYSKSGADITFGLRGFVGVEYFFAPKISVGAEFGWGFGLMTDARGEVEVESWNATDNVVETEVTEGSTGGMSFGFGVDDGASQILAPSSALNLIFHF